MTVAKAIAVLLLVTTGTSVCGAAYVTVSCFATFSSLKNQTSYVKCPAGCPTTNTQGLCGTDTYARGSICVGAIHARQILGSVGGIMTIHRAAPLLSYTGSKQRGITSVSCTASTYSYTFGVPAAMTTAFYRRPADGSCGKQITNNVNNCGGTGNFNCMNGGTCMNGVNSFSCLCPYGYSGPRCQSNMLNCVATPCKNGGNCTRSRAPQKSRCSCAGSQFTGPFCGKPFSSCYAGVYNASIVADSQITASSFYAVRHEPYRCRLNGVITSASIGAWATKVARTGDWIQVDFLAPKRIYGVLTKGRPSLAQRVTQYKISYGDSTTGMLYIKDKNNVDKIFAGNTDQVTVVGHQFSEPITARYWRLHVVAYFSWSSTQLEYLTC